jgi:hypothetical protein
VFEYWDRSGLQVPDSASVRIQGVEGGWYPLLSHPEWFVSTARALV